MDTTTPHPHMRRHRQLLSAEDTVSVLQRGTSGVLALITPDGHPYAVPISYVYADGHLYFHSALKGLKLDAIAYCSSASFCVIGLDDVRPDEYTTYFRSVIAFGQMHIIEDEAEKLRTLHLLSDRYNPGETQLRDQEIAKSFRAMCMLDMEITSMTGKESIELVRARTADQP